MYRSKSRACRCIGFQNVPTVVLGPQCAASTTPKGPTELSGSGLFGWPRPIRWLRLGVRRCRGRAAAVAAALVAAMLIKKSLCAVGTFSLPAPLLLPME